MSAHEPATAEIEATLKKAAAALRRAEVPFILGGSLAAWAQGGPVSRKDLDLMIRPEDAEGALEALEAEGMRPERPPEDWLLKAWDGDVLVDLIFHAKGLPVDDEVFGRAVEMDVLSLPMKVLSLEDMIVTKLLVLDEHTLDMEPALRIARAVRERVDWAAVRARSGHSPYARAFFTLVEELEIVEPPDGAAPAAARRSHVRVVGGPAGAAAPERPGRQPPE